MKFLLLLISCLSCQAGQYITSFPLTEDPISENNNWTNGFTIGLDWANVKTTPGYAYGLDTNGTFADPTAILAGTWGATQTVTAVVKVTTTPTMCCSEVEVRLRSVITNHWNRGYEILWSEDVNNDYVSMVVWHGPHGDEGVGWDRITETSGFGAPVNGDILIGSISNNVLRAFKNGSLILTGTDNEWSDGNPGIGFYGETSQRVGFSSIAVTDGFTNITATRTARIKGIKLGR